MMWKGECAKVSRKIEVIVTQLQNKKGHLDSTTVMVKKMQKLLWQAACKELIQGQ